MLFGPNIKALKEKKEYAKLAELLTHKDKKIRLESAKALLGAIIEPALGQDHFKKFDIARLFRGIDDDDILNVLLEPTKGYGHTGLPEHKPLINAILFANGFDELLELLIKRGEGDLVGDWFQNALTEGLLSYAAGRHFGIDVFVKIIPYAKCQHFDSYTEIRNYFKSLPNIKLPKAQVDEIRTMIEKRIEETKKGENIIFQGYNTMDGLLLEKIIPE